MLFRSEQIERQRLQQAELITRIAEQEQQTLINQREQLRRMDNGQEQAQTYNPHGARDSYRQRHRSREPAVEGRASTARASREPSRERSERSAHSGSMRRASREPSPAGGGETHKASFRSGRSGRPEHIEAAAPPSGPGAAKRRSEAEQELQMTEDVVNPEGQTTLAQLGPTQIAVRVALAVFLAAGLGVAIFTILSRLS